MRSMQQSKLFAREELAGYRREILDEADVAVIGDGALGMNVALNLALSGVRRLRCTDPDVCEMSNATRSPLMKRERLAGKTPRHKAVEAALGFIANSYATDPEALAAVDRVERLGLGALTGAKVLIAAVDRDDVRAWICNAGRLLGIPVIEAGFFGSLGQVTVWRNDVPDGPCWRCLRPDVATESASCLQYALAIQAEGRVAATQPVAALFGALVTHAVLDALHGNFPFDGAMLAFDLSNGRSRRIEVDRNPDCPGAHRRLPAPIQLEIEPTRSLSDLFAAVANVGVEPEIRLPSPYIVQLPCAICGARTSVGKPSFDVVTPPICAECPSDVTPGTPLVFSTLPESALPRSMRVSRLGLGPGAIFECAFADGESRAFRLGGDALSVFRRFTRSERSTSTTAVTND